MKAKRILAKLFLHFQQSRKFLLIVAFCVSSCAISGCIAWNGELSSDSRLPKWITVPPGLTRADVIVQEEEMDTGGKIAVILYNKKFKTLEKVRGKQYYLSGGYFIDIVDGVPEVIAHTTHKWKNIDKYPYLFVVDDPALKRKLLNENKEKLLHIINNDVGAVFIQSPN